MQSVNLATDLEIESLEQLAELIAATGTKMLRVGQDLAADRLGEAALALNPDEGRTQLLMADLAIHHGERARAVKALETALKLDIDHTEITQRLNCLERP